MIRKLTMEDKQAVLEFSYLCERENMFVIGSFENYEDTFEENDFWGFFEGDEMVGLAVLFWRFGTLVVNSLSDDVIDALVDEVVHSGGKIRCSACFARYTKRIVKRLEFHGIKAKKVRDEVVYILEQKDFVDFSDGSEEIAKKEDVDEIVRCVRGVDDSGEPITDTERARVFFDREFILRVDGKIVSKANTHGVSDHFFQIGGVGTMPEYRRRGYAARVVSALCRHYFAKGVEFGLLFTTVDNVAARKLYEKMGFREVDEYMIAEF